MSADGINNRGSIRPLPPSAAAGPVVPSRADSAPSTSQSREAPDNLDSSKRASSAKLTGASGQTEAAATPLSPDKLVSLRADGGMPLLIVKPAKIFGAVDNGKLTVRLPMRPGAKIGPAKVPADLWVDLKLVVNDGKIVRKETRVEFVDSHGNPAELDGPWLFDTSKIYIDQLTGQLKADVNCLPDLNLTPSILGVNSAPRDVGDFMDLLDKQAGMHVALIGDEAPEAAANKSKGKAKAKGKEESSIADAFNFDRMQTMFEGQLTDRAIDFGTGTVLNIKKGSRVAVDGGLGDMNIAVNAQVASLSAKSGGTHFSTGPGNVSFTAHIERGPASDAVDAPTLARSSVGIDAMHVENVRLITPGDDGNHRLEVAALNVVASLDDPPAIASSSSKRIDDPASEGESNLRIHLPNVSLRGVGATLKVRGSDGNSGSILLGSHGTARTAVDIQATLLYDSSAALFELNTHANNLSIETGRLALVDSKQFDLTLGHAAINGSGSINVTQSAAVSRYHMVADPGSQWLFTTQIDDMVIGDPTDTSRLVADLAPATSGSLQLEKIDLRSDRPPVITGSGRFDITLDGLRLPMGGKQSIELKKGTRGVLTIDKMNWDAKTRAPEVRAQLRLELGAGVKVTPGSIPGLQGANFEADIKTGKSVLVLDAQVNTDGTLNFDCGISLKSAELRTRLASGMQATDLNVVASSKPLPPQATSKLAKMRSLRPLPKPPAKAAPLEQPPLPVLEIRPGQVMAMIDTAMISVEVPVKRLNGAIISTDSRHDETTLWVKDTVGSKLTISSQREAAPIHVGIVSDQGQLQADKSALTFNKPLTLAIDYSHDFAGPMAVGFNGSLTIDKLQFVKDPDSGRLYVLPSGDAKHWLWSGAKALGLDDNAKVMIGKSLTKWLFGSETIDPKMRNIFTPGGLLSEAIVVDTNPVRQPATPPRGVGKQRNTSLPLSQIVSIGETKIEIKEGRLARSTLALGNGQQITFDSDSRITMAGTANDFTIRGRVNLSSFALGSGENSATGKAATADIEIRVEQLAHGKSKTHVQIHNLSADDLTVTTRVGGTNAGGPRAVLSRAKVDNASIDLQIGPTSNFSFNLPNVEGRLLGGGHTESGGVSAGVHTLDAQVKGSLSYRDGKLAGELQQVDLRASGVAFSTGSNDRTEAGFVSVAGSARLSTDAAGAFIVTSSVRGKPLTFNTDLRLSDGSTLAISKGTAKTLRWDPNASTLDATGLEADLSGVLGLSGPEVTDPSKQSLVDIRSAHVTGDLRVSANGLSTLGELRFTRMQTSLSNITGVKTANSLFDLGQIDLMGNGHMTITEDGQWGFRGDNREVNGSQRSSIVGRARGDRIRFTTASPEMDFQLRSGAMITADMHAFWISPKTKDVSMSLSHGQLDSVVDEGSITVAEKSVGSDKLAFAPGTRLLAKVPLLEIKTGIYSTRPEQAASVALDFLMQVQGGLVDTGANLQPRFKTDAGGVGIDSIELDGKVSLAVGGRFRDGAFEIDSHAQADANFNIKGSGTIDGKAVSHNLQQPTLDADLRN